MRPMSVEELSMKIESQLATYMDMQQKQPFANFLIQQFLINQGDLDTVNNELCSIWCAVDHHRDIELLVTVYENFLRDIYSTVHIYFFVQAHRIIDRVINGDGDGQVLGRGSLADEYIPVERVVDIVEEIFKSSAALSIFENTTMLEIEYARLQSIIQSLLQNVNIVY